MDELYANQLEILDIKQQLYLKLLSMRRYLNGANLYDFAQVADPEKFIRKYNQDRHVYIWSDYFNAEDNLFLIHYLKVNEIKHVLLSPGVSPNLVKISDFLKLADRYDVKVSGMIGNNEVVKTGNPSRINELVQAIYNLGFQEVHFDIEPHTFPDWDKSREMYLNKYSTVLESGSAYARNLSMNVSVSIPLFYPENTLSSIYSSSDNVYLMAYERPDIPFIERKTAEERALNSKKTIIELRTKDFPNRLYMEKFIDALGEVVPLPVLAIHDLGTLFELDYKSSMGYK